MGQNRVLSACYSFLVPVARFLLRSGVSFNEFTELARTAFVQVAGEEYGLRGRPTNISRVAAMTGIPRKEIRRIRDLIDQYGSTPRDEISPLGDVLHHWYTDQDFLDSDGRPLPLPSDGIGMTFELLAKRYAGDLPSGALKSELLRTGAVTLNDDDQLVPTRRQAVPEQFDDKLITSLSFNLYGLASTIAFNSNSKRTGAGRIERVVQSDHVSPESKAILRDSLRNRIDRFTIDIDNMFSKTGKTSDRDMGRVGVGIYYFEEDD